MAFIFDAQKGQTPQSVARQREMAALILGRIGNRPANSALDGIGNALASIGQGIGARTLNKRADAAEQAGVAEADALSQDFTDWMVNRDTFPDAPGGGSMPMDPASQRVASAFANQGDMSAYGDAIASIESAGSGGYEAVGPTHPELGRALGKYQVMEANIGPWSQEALGRPVSAEEFLQNPEIQEQVFNHRFGQYVNQYGPEGAAQAWFGGPGGVGQTDRQDSLGTSIGAYTDKFNAALGRGGDPSRIPVMAGGTAGIRRPGESSPVDIRMLMDLVRKPFVDDSTKAIAGSMLAQQFQTAKPTDTQRNLAWRAEQAGLRPGTREYADFMIAGGSGPQSVVNVSTGEGDTFFKELDKGNAQMFQTLQQEGLNAGQTLVRLDRLEELLSNVPTGVAANFQKIAGDWGINTEGLDNIQAATALINQMVPQQRPAGSGPMSDADLELFKQSVPRIINQPGGNKLIIDTMRGIAQYSSEQGRIAAMVANREITPAVGRRLLAQLQNPLEGFGRGGGDSDRIPAGVEPSDWEFMTPEERRLFQ